jgi:hypothetical protein
VITRVASCPSGFRLGPVSTRARKPYAITAVSRADTSLTGFGKLNSRRIASSISDFSDRNTSPFTHRPEARTGSDRRNSGTTLAYNPL